MGVPASPVLVADSQTNTSVRVRWEGANRSNVPLNVSYRLQWKYESLNGGWEYYRPKVPIVETIQQINGLQPYTKYRVNIFIEKTFCVKKKIAQILSSHSAT